MKIQYLGTAAAEGYPALFCQCDACEKARALGGKDIRTRSQAIVDDKTICYVHHFSHNIDRTHTELCDEMNKKGFGVSYDGEIIEF